MLYWMAPVLPHTVMFLLHGDHDNHNNLTGFETKCKCLGVFHNTHCLYLTSEKGFWDNIMGNQRTPRISAGVRSQSSRGGSDVLPFITITLISLANRALPSLSQLALKQGKKYTNTKGKPNNPTKPNQTTNHKPQLLLMFPSALFGGLVQRLCWLCFCLGHCEMEMQDSLVALALQSSSSGENNLQRGLNCGHGLNCWHCFRRVRWVQRVTAQSVRTAETDSDVLSCLFTLNQPGWSSPNPTTDLRISDFQSKSQ